jgi:hypothetical protein
MEDYPISIDQSKAAVYELWLIATLSSKPYDESIDNLQTEMIERPKYPESWAGVDMAMCARHWLSRILSAKYRAEPRRFAFEKRSELDQEAESLWNSFKGELRILVCTQDKKYKDLRAQIAKMTGQKSQLAIMSAVASGIAVQIGFATSTILTPLCAICFLAGARIGRELLCSRLAQKGFEPIGVELGKESRIDS